MDTSFFNPTGAYLEVELNEIGDSKFCKSYASITGESPVIGQGYQLQKNKWGTECRIYFNCDSDLKDKFAKLGIKVEDSKTYKPEWKFRVNNDVFFWALIKAGYRLGNNPKHPTD